MSRVKLEYVWQEIEGYITELTTFCSSIQSIWLFGSRINGTARPDSDWDLLVFGTQKTLEELNQNIHLKQDNIDLLVVYNDNDFQEPWPLQPGNDRQKRGSLKEWCWKKLNQRIAYYQGTKEIEDNSFYVKSELLRANRIYPK